MVGRSGDEVAGAGSWKEGVDEFVGESSSYSLIAWALFCLTSGIYVTCCRRICAIDRSCCAATTILGLLHHWPYDRWRTRICSDDC